MVWKFLNPHSNLKVVKGDVRNIDEIPLEGVECIIHLASIANDPCGDLNPKLTWEVSTLATMIPIFQFRINLQPYHKHPQTL